MTDTQYGAPELALVRPTRQTNASSNAAAPAVASICLYAKRTKGEWGLLAYEF